jgi:hypothetical protein
MNARKVLTSPAEARAEQFGTEMAGGCGDAE